MLDVIKTLERLERDLALLGYREAAHLIAVASTSVQEAVVREASWFEAEDQRSEVRSA